MGMARYVVDAVLLEGRSVREVARAHGLSKTWIYELLGRYRAGGYEALEPRSRRPRNCPHETPAELVAQILCLRQELADAGHDCGAATIRYHLLADRETVPCRATIWRILKRHGLITPQPQKRPICTRIRFEADLPNEMWQTDITHWQLSGGQPAEILNLIDDHSRLFLGSDAYPRTKANDVVQSFHKAAQLHGLPYSLLSDNGAVFTASPRKGKVLLETELERLGVAVQELTPLPPPDLRQGRAPTPNTQALPRQAATSTKRSPSSRPSSTPSPTTTTTSAPTEPSAAKPRYRPTAPASRPDPPAPAATTHFRVREDKVDQYGKVSLRHNSHLYKIGLGRAHKGRTSQAADRRPNGPRHRHQRPAPTPANTRPEPRPTSPCPPPNLSAIHPRHLFRDHLRLHKMRPEGIEPSACGLKDRCSLEPRRVPLTTELRALDAAVQTPAGGRGSVFYAALATSATS